MAALSLVTGLFIVVGAGLTVAMLLIFMIAIGWAINRKLNMDCGCFGFLYRERIGPRTLVRDGVLLLLALVVLLFDRQRFSLAAMTSGMMIPGDVIALAFMAVTVVLGGYAGVLSWRQHRMKPEYAEPAAD